MEELNPDKDISEKEYRQAALNTRAFEYESIRNQQENKGFWVQVGALVVIVGVSIICHPAGLALGAAYGALELSSAVSGTSKGSKSFADWYIYKKENIPVNPVFREKMILKEKELEIEI